MTHQKLDEFRQRLLDSESVDPSLRRRFQTEVQTMWERKLTIQKQIFFKLLAMLCLIFGLGFAFLAIVAPGGFPPLIRLAWGAGSLFCFGSLAMLVQMIRRGAMRLRTNPMMMTGLVWGFVVIMVTIFMIVAGSMPDTSRGVLMVVNGTVFLIGAGLMLIRTVIEQSEMRTRERLLEIEYRLEELMEELKKRDGGDEAGAGVRI